MATAKDPRNDCVRQPLWTTRTFAIAICAVSLLGTACAAADEGSPGGGAAIVDPSDRRARDALDRALSGFPGAERGKVIPIADASVERLMTGFRFYVLRFPRYPVARVVPPPLQASNLLVVQPDDAVVLLTGASELERFFQGTLPPITTESQAKNALRAWLRLSQEFRQDGFLRFSIPDAVELAPGPGSGQQVTGKAVVTPHGGDQGELVATLAFDSSGRLTSATETANIRRGIRPICQATKLLDPDPIVRAMAEQAILVMGKDAGAYLEEQRALASPELQRAIDRIWEQIVAEDR